MKKQLKKIIHSLPYIKQLYAFSEHYKKNACFYPGHYYSTIVNVDEIDQNQERIWSNVQKEDIEGIPLFSSDQIEIGKQFSNFYNEIPFKDEKQSHIRYYFDNGYYRHTDGIVLYSILRFTKPKRIIEIGSGFSSAVMLDVNNLFFDTTIQLTFIEPYPTRLKSLLTEKDNQNITILQSKVQEVDLSLFKTLEAGDILFIDSTHVSKCDSDLNRILFEILPLIKKGVYIHFHDIFYPFEYPKEWVLKGYNWNENYILRAFLMHNEKYKIIFFSHYMHLHHPEVFKEMPAAYNDFGGSLWLQKK